MSSAELYRAIREENRGDLEVNEPRLDGYVMDPSRDFRRGVSLILRIRLDEGAYKAFIDTLARVEPDQYYYPIGDLHTTIFDFARARAGFTRDSSRESAFFDIARSACAATYPFKLTFRGAICSREAGLIAGYDDDALVDLRQRIRDSLAAAEIDNDERYISRSAHCTFMLFAAKFRSPGRFLDAVDEWGEEDFGALFVQSAELVAHDWYNRMDSVRSLGICGFASIGPGQGS